MSRKIIGVTVGTPLSIQTIKEKINPVISINGVEADENGNVEITIPDSGGNAEDGFSPIAKVEQTDTGAVISITDKNGETTATITNGKDGDDGTDGISPTVAVSKSGRVTTLTITDKNGTKTATINDGADGKDGETGERGFSFLYYNGSNLDSDEDFINLNHLAAPAGYDPQIGDLMLCADGYVFEIVGLSPDTGAEVRSTGICLIGKDGATGAQGEPGEDGQRGAGILKVSTAPTSYTTATGGKNPIKRMALSTIKSQAEVSEVVIGDLILHGSYLYHTYYLDKTYAYMDSYTYIKGANGSAGAAGTSVTVSSVTESTESGGSNVVTFSDGKTLTVKNGKDGSDGYTPIRGTDYWTPTDRQQIKQELTAAMVTQEAGESESLVMSQKAVTDLVNDVLGENATTQYETVDSVEKMTDTSKAYVLSTTGTIWAYGENTVEIEPPNKFVPSNAVLNQRISGSSGSVSANNSSIGSFVTDFIAVPDFAQNTPFNVRLNFETVASDENKVVFFNSSKARAGNTLVGINGAGGVYPNTTVSNGETVIDIKTPHNSSTVIPTDVAYVRFQLFVKPVGTSLTSADVADITITFDHEGGTKTENTWYDTGMEPSASGGVGNYVDLLKKVNDNKTAIAELDARVTACETGSETLTIPSFWRDAVDATIAKIKALQVGKNCVTFPFFSDNHQRNGYAGLLIAHIMQECHIPYAFFGGDSISNGTIADEAEMIAQDKAFDTIMSYVPNGRFCRAVGNHDGYWYDGTNRFSYDRNQVYELFLREEAIAQNKHFGDDGTYYYVDDITSGVRFIVLNTNGGSVDDAQIAWFRDTALNVDAGWCVVVISHQPISNHYHALISNAADVRAVAVNSGKEIIGWFSGHIHRDRIYTGVATNTTDDTEGAAMGFTQVTITSDYTGIAYDDATKHTVASDDKSHAIDFVTINRDTRTVNLTRLGIGEDRSYTY